MMEEGLYEERLQVLWSCMDERILSGMPGIGTGMDGGMAADSGLEAGTGRGTGADGLEAGTDRETGADGLEAGAGRGTGDDGSDAGAGRGTGADGSDAGAGRGTGADGLEAGADKDTGDVGLKPGQAPSDTAALSGDSRTERFEILDADDDGMLVCGAGANGMSGLFRVGHGSVLEDADGKSVRIS